MDGTTALLIQVAQGIGLAACAGMRAFLPLFVVGLAGRVGWIPLSDSFQWLASTPALVVFGVALLVELAADKFPVVDNVLDTVQFLVKPVAGTVLVASVVTELTPLQTTVLAIIVGGTTTDVVHLGKAKLRLVSSATTAGIGNPVLSTAEDGGSLVGSLLAIFYPLLLLAALIVLILLLVLILRGIRRPRAAPQSDV